MDRDRDRERNKARVGWELRGDKLRLREINREETYQHGQKASSCLKNLAAELQG